MAWIHVVPLHEARGLLRRQYEAAIRRAGRIWNIVSIMSVNPKVMQESMHFYMAVMYGPSPLRRGQREMLATVVSATNHCVY